MTLPCTNPVCTATFEPTPNGRKRYCSRACQLADRNGMTYTAWRRHLARSESWALRHLYRAHGRLPACQPAHIMFDDYTTDRNALRARQYRRNKKEAAA